AARGTRCVLRHWHWSVGTRPRVWSPRLCAGFAPRGASGATPRRAHRGGCAGVRPGPAAAPPGALAGLRPRARGNTREEDGHAERRTRAGPRPGDAPAAAQSPRRTRWWLALWAPHARLSPAAPGMARCGLPGEP